MPDVLFVPVLIGYLAILSMLFVFGVSFVYLTLLALRSTKREPAAVIPDVWPVVTVQLPIYNEATGQLDELWPQIPPARFQETLTAFGQYPGVLHDLILYVIDNEIHHRGQGYVYLRALGIEPPPFFNRS